MSDAFPHEPLPEAKMRRHRFSSIWLIPIIAALIAGYLGFRSYSQQGPLVTIFFRTAEGLNAGQTAIKYKSVTLGTVEDIALKEDRSGVIVHARMKAQTDNILTDHARFWIEKQRLSTANISDIVSGTYIQMDPGPPGGDAQTIFTGLENQPALPIDEPGSSYKLNARALGSITSGTPIYYRDVNAGKVLGYDIGDGSGPIIITIFVRAPYDRFVKSNSYFWNASGLSIKMGTSGPTIELQSLQSVLSGGIAFDMPAESIKAPQADGKSIFMLYEDRYLAEAASHGKHIPCVTYVQSPIKDLAAGSPVQIFGIDIGIVTDVKLVMDSQSGTAKVRVAFDIQPDLVFGPGSSGDAEQIIRQLVQKGMRVKMASSNLIMGAEVLSLEFMPKTQAAEVTLEDGAMVLPGQGGDMDSLGDTLSDIAVKLDKIPFDEIGQHLDHLINSADQTIGGPEMQRAVHSLAVTLANAQHLSREARQNLTPALQKLPEISRQLQDAVTQANAFLSSVNGSYGQNSDFQRNSRRALDEASEAARSIRLLADYLEHHPEALIQGKAPDKGQP